MQPLEDILAETANLTVLYAEDDPFSRELFEELLYELFGTVIVAVDGADAYKKYREQPTDLVITDITMPGLDGFALTEAIRKIDEQVPVVMFSAYKDTDYFMKAVDIGIDAYLLKPLDVERFLATLKRLIPKIRLIAEAQENVALLQQYQLVVDTSSIVSKTDVNGVITYVNDAFCHISGYSREELIGKNHNIVRHPDESEEIFEEIWYRIKKEKKPWQGIIKNMKKDGSTYYVKATISPIFERDGTIREYIALRDDISEIMNQQRAFDQHFSLLKEPVVVYMKLEEFSTIEDFYDAEMVCQIQEKVRIFLEHEMMARGISYGKLYKLRYGEFAVAFETTLLKGDINGFINDLKLFLEDVRDRVVPVNDLQFQISLIMSIAYKNSNILESARIGIKKLCDMNRDFIIANNFSHLEKMNAQKNLHTIATVKKALHEDNILCHYQPIVNNKTGEVARYESLVRLVDESGTVRYPAEFLDIAKRGKYYYQITQIVLKKSFQILAECDIEVSINLSLRDLQSGSIRQTIHTLLQTYAQHTHKVTFELLEDADIKNFNTITSFITLLKSKGIKIAIDDFGSGYSNYERLLSYRPDILKIDGSLIKNIDDNRYSLSIVKTIVAFAKDQNILTTAEFVENEAIFNLVRDLGIDYSQGYYFGKAIPLQGDSI